MLILGITDTTIIILASKPLISTRFSNPRLADLAIDAFLNAKRSEGINNSSSSTGVTNDSSPSSSFNGKARDDSLDPIIWFEAFEDLSSRRSAANNGGNGSNGVRRGNKTRARQNSYTISDEDEDDDGSDEDDSDNDEEDEDDEDVDDDDDDNDQEGIAHNAWASTSQIKIGDMSSSSNNGQATAKMSTSYGCCHISHNNLYFLVPMRKDCKRISSRHGTRMAFIYIYADYQAHCELYSRPFHTILISLFPHRRTSSISRRRSKRCYNEREL